MKDGTFGGNGASVSHDCHKDHRRPVLTGHTFGSHLLRRKVATLCISEKPFARADFWNRPIVLRINHGASVWPSVSKLAETSVPSITRPWQAAAEPRDISPAPPAPPVPPPPSSQPELLTVPGKPALWHLFKWSHGAQREPGGGQKRRGPHHEKRLTFSQIAIPSSPFSLIVLNETDEVFVYWVISIPIRIIKQGWSEQETRVHPRVIVTYVLRIKDLLNQTNTNTILPFLIIL